MQGAAEVEVSDGFNVRAVLVHRGELEGMRGEAAEARHEAMAVAGEDDLAAGRGTGPSVIDDVAHGCVMAHHGHQVDLRILVQRVTRSLGAGSGAATIMRQLHDPARRDMDLE